VINVLIFSKNRACQLDLLLRSIWDNFSMLKHNTKLHVLYKADNEEYDKAYLHLIRTLHPHLNAIWKHEEVAFKDEVMRIANRFDEPYILCFVDDDVVIKNINIVPMLQIFNRNSNINALSLRMGKHIDYCYAKDQPQRVPDFIQTKERILKWDWTKAEHDWGYPMSLAGNIYRTEEIVELWRKLPFTSPNYMEGYMAQQAPAQTRPYQMTFAFQRVYNVANNLVQTVCNNRHKDAPGDAPALLNDHYLKGYRLSTETLYNKSFNCANGEVEYILKKI